MPFAHPTWRDRVVIQRPGRDPRRGGAERGAASATGPILAVSDVEEDDLLVGDGPDLAVVGGLAPPELAARRTGGLARGAVDGYGADVGADGLHSLRAPVGRLSTHKHAGFNSPGQRGLVCRDLYPPRSRAGC